MTDERITRLVGDGTGAAGTAIPLPAAFGAVLQQLLDYGNTPYPLLAKRIADASLIRMKEDRILSIWKDWDAFCEDIIAVLHRRKLIRAKGVYWELTPVFREGRSLEVITPEEVKEATGGRAVAAATVTVFGSVSRSERNETDLAISEVNKCRAALSRLDRLNRNTERYFAKIQDELYGRAREDSNPARLPDEPDFLVKCKGDCGQEKPQTDDNYLQYLSRGKWYWRTKCRECMNGTITRTEKILEVFPRIVQRNGGRLPTNKQLARAAGCADSTAARAWDNLAAKGLVPERPVR